MSKPPRTPEEKRAQEREAKDFQDRARRRKQQAKRRSRRRKQGRKQGRGRGRAD